MKFPTTPGPYRMHTASGNVYFVVVEHNRYDSGGASVHVFQPKRFRCETFSSVSEKDITREFEPTQFDPLWLEDDDGETCADLQNPSFRGEPVID